MPNKASSQSRNAIFAVAAISIISSYICIFLVNKNFSFTEGWYLSWGGNAAQAYARGMPFPPFYAILHSIFVSLFERIGLDPFAGLRIIGVLIFSATLYGLYKILNFLKLSKWASIIGSSCALSIAVGMEAYVSYDYTPFIMMLIIVSTYCCIKCVQDNSSTENPNIKTLNTFTIIAALSMIALLASKQNFIFFAICFSLVFIYKANRKLTILYITTLCGGLAIYFSSLAFAIGWTNAIDIYTNTSFKGGGNSILLRVPPALYNSFRNFDVIMFIALCIKPLIISILIALVLIKILRSDKELPKSNRAIVNSYVSIAAITVVCAWASTKFSQATPMLRTSSIFYIFILWLIYLWLRRSESPRFPELNLARIKLIFISLVVAMLNSMSGGTGGLDALLPLAMISGYFCQAAITFTLESSTKQAVIGKFHFINQEFHINKLPLFMMICLPLAGAISIKNNGYKWWGISENRPLKPIFILPFSKRAYVDNVSKNILGASVMSNNQIEFSSKVLKNFNAENTRIGSNTIGVSNFLSFPNIPYFYSLTGSKPYANIPIQWIDVTSTKSSRLIINEWKHKKPNMITFSLLPLSAYTIQGSAFSSKSAEEIAFIRLNKEIIQMILNGEMLVIDSYQGDDSSNVILLLKNANPPPIHSSKVSTTPNAYNSSNKTREKQASTAQTNLLHILLPCRFPPQGLSCREREMRQFLVSKVSEKKFSPAENISRAFELDYLEFALRKSIDQKELNNSTPNLGLIKNASHFGVDVEGLIRFANYYTENYVSIFPDWGKE